MRRSAIRPFAGPAEGPSNCHTAAMLAPRLLSLAVVAVVYGEAHAQARYVGGSNTETNDFKQVERPRPFAAYPASPVGCDDARRCRGGGGACGYCSAHYATGPGEI